MAAWASPDLSWSASPTTFAASSWNFADRPDRKELEAVPGLLGTQEPLPEGARVLPAGVLDRDPRTAATDRVQEIVQPGAVMADRLLDLVPHRAHRAKIWFSSTCNGSQAAQRVN